MIKEFFYRQSQNNVEVQQYFWTLWQVFTEQLRIKDLYELPVMSYRYLNAHKLYTKAGKPKNQRGLLLRYTNLKEKSVRREYIIPYEQVSKLY